MELQYIGPNGRPVLTIEDSGQETLHEQGKKLREAAEQKKRTKLKKADVQGAGNAGNESRP